MRILTGIAFILQLMTRTTSQNNFFVLLILFTCLSCSIAKNGGKIDRMPGTWQQQPVKIDGDCTDWPSPYPNYDAKAMVAYATSNDGKNLYITVQTGDPLTQIKILKQGMSVSVDTGGRRDATFTINYPLMNNDDLSELFSQPDGQKAEGGPSHLSRQFDQKLRKSAENSNQYTLEGFPGCNGGYLISQTAPCGIEVKLSIDEYKQLVWEAVIPLKALLNKETISAADAGKDISVCYSIKAFKSPSTKGGDNTAMPMNNNNNMGQGGMGGGGRMNSMPMSTGSGSKQGPHMAHLYESTKTWKFFHLAWGK
jgi:hypothetical protein